jgi:hypothetical protein
MRLYLFFIKIILLKVLCGQLGTVASYQFSAVKVNCLAMLTALRILQNAHSQCHLITYYLKTKEIYS